MVTIVSCRHIDRRFEPGLQQCSPPPAPPDRGLGAPPVAHYFVTLALSIFSPLNCYNYLHLHQ